MQSRGVVVAHREAMVAEGIAAALSRYPHIVALAAVTTARELEGWTERADAVALDPYLPGGAEVAAKFRRQGVRVVFLGGSGEDEGIRVSTKMPVSSLASALAPDAVVETRTAPRLTGRQQEILALVARGLPGKQVARHLGISPKTVEHHKARIFAKLGVANQTAAVSLALSEALARSHPWIPSNT
jgi:DNA-binding NarL/FixJ family response regulator